MKKAFIICIIIIVLLLISLVSLYFINNYYKDETKPDTTGMFGTGYWYDGQGAQIKLILNRYLDNNRIYSDLEDFIDEINKHNQEIETKEMNSYVNIIAPEIVKTETIKNKYGEYVEIFVLSGNKAKQSGYYTIKELSRDEENDFINVVSIELQESYQASNDLKNG
ncbi:MAG: hypothetical protein IKR04_06040 [Clostridia bacterium]|nr:hypothetical protein [Clostridia bacterium]